MRRPLSLQHLLGYALSDGVILTAATLVASISNYAFQAWMRRNLSWSEFGYLNSTLSLILFAGVPLAAASQTVTHHLAFIEASGDGERMVRVQAASLKFLRHFSWILFLASLILLYPVSYFLHFPRMSLAWIALFLIPINLWSALGGAWCTGLSRFRLLALLTILSALVRLLFGGVATCYYPWADTGLIATMLAGLVLASVVVISPHHGTTTSIRRALQNSQLLWYGAGALAVTFGTFSFLQGDQIIAQRHFPGEELGRYSGAGLLGRAIVWISLPVLTVYFTRRSGHHPTRQSPAPLLWFYLGLMDLGVIFLVLFKVPLLSLLLGVHDPELIALAMQFAVVMIPIGILQAVGIHFLAARRIFECLIFGLCGMVYLIALTLFGQTPDLMLGWMGGMASASVLFLGLVAMVRYLKFRSQYHS